MQCCLHSTSDIEDSSRQTCNYREDRACHITTVMPVQPSHRSLHLSLLDDEAQAPTVGPTAPSSVTCATLPACLISHLLLRPEPLGHMSVYLCLSLFLCAWSLYHQLFTSVLPDCLRFPLGTPFQKNLPDPHITQVSLNPPTQTHTLARVCAHTCINCFTLQQSHTILHKTARAVYMCCTMEGQCEQMK